MHRAMPPGRARRRRDRAFRPAGRQPAPFAQGRRAVSRRQPVRGAVRDPLRFAEDQHPRRRRARAGGGLPHGRRDHRRRRHRDDAAIPAAPWRSRTPKLCAIPFAGLEELMQTIPGLQHSVRQTLAHEVSRNHGLMLLLGSMRAEERVAAYLLDLAERYRQRGYSSSEFVLRMTREEIGSYLGPQAGDGEPRVLPPPGRRVGPGAGPRHQAARPADAQPDAGQGRRRSSIADPALALAPRSHAPSRSRRKRASSPAAPEARPRARECGQRRRAAARSHAARARIPRPAGAPCARRKSRSR